MSYSPETGKTGRYLPQQEMNGSYLKIPRNTSAKSFSFFLFIYFCIGDRTQGLTHAGQVLYH